MNDSHHIESLHRHYANQINVLKSQYSVCQRQLEKLESNVETKRIKLGQVKQLRDETKDRLIEIQEEIDCDPQPEQKQPLSRIQKRDFIQMQLNQYELAYTSEQESFQQAMNEVNDAEKKLLASDKKINDYLSTMEDPQLALTFQFELDKERSKRLAKMDEERAKKLVHQQYGLDLIKELKAQQENTNKALHKIAIQRQQAALDVTKTVKESVESYKADYLQTRKRAEEEYQSDITAVEALIKTDAEKHIRKVNAMKKRLEDEKEDMIRKGLNPYTEFRKQTFDREARKREKKMKDRVEENKSILAETLIKEEEERLLREAEERRIKGYEKLHRAEQGRHYIEEKNSKYIQSITIGNQDVLDPTGREAHIFPSKVTHIPDHSFGLGKSSRIPEDIRQQIIESQVIKQGIDRSDVGEYDRLINTVNSEFSNTLHTLQQSEKWNVVTINNNGNTEIVDSDEEKSPTLLKEQLMSTNHQSALNETNADVNINQDSKNNEDIFNKDMTISKYSVAKLSKFEQNSLNRSIAKHKERIEQGQTQVVNGRVYQGKGFVSKPGELLFQDFDVGKVYKKRFIITNVSYTFNSFKIIDFDPEIAEYFTLLYDRPGRISAGVSCVIDLIFKPIYNEDIITSIKLLCDTGPTEIPLKCLMKRCAPKVLDTNIDFGHIVIGQKVKKPIKIMNTQAIGSDIIITRIDQSLDGDRIIESIVPIQGNEKGEEDGREDKGKNRNRNDESDDRIEKIWYMLKKAENNPNINPTMSQIYKKYHSVDFSAYDEVELMARVNRITTSAYNLKQQKTPYPIYTQRSELYINGYDSMNAEIIVEPLRYGIYQQSFLCTFPQLNPSNQGVDSNDSVISNQQMISVSMIGEPLPIEVVTPIIDMKCCYYDRIYRQHCELHNNGKVSYRINIRIDDMFQSYVEINPTNIIIQAHETILLHVKFLPRIEILQKLSYFTLRNKIYKNTGAIALPIKLEVFQQELPLHFTLRAIVTNPKLILSKRIINYGNCYINQQVVQSITITNPSILPQKIAFTKLKKEISITPNDGFAVLLPNESVDFDISFTPMSAIDYKYDITLSSSTSDLYLIQLQASGIEIPIEMSGNVLNLRSTSPGEKVVESTFIKNVSNISYLVEIIVPERLLCWIRLSPNAIELKPGEEKRIEIEYFPPSDALESIINPKEWYRNTLYNILKYRYQNKNTKMKIKTAFDDTNRVSDIDVKCTMSMDVNTDSNMMPNNGVTTTIASGIFGTITWIGRNDNNNNGNDNNDNNTISNEVVGNRIQEKNNIWNEKCVLGRWRFPVFFRPNPSNLSIPKISSNHNNSDNSNDNMAQLLPSFYSLSSSQPPMFMKMETIVTVSELIADTSIIDFDNVVIGSSITRRLILTNKSDHKITLQCQSIPNAVGVYEIVNALRSIAPGGSFEVMISCQPNKNNNQSIGIVTETIEFSGSNHEGGHRVKIQLRCRIIRPIIEITGLHPPPYRWDIRGGILDFGNVVVSDTASMKFTLFNTQSIPKQVRIVSVNNVSTGLNLNSNLNTSSTIHSTVGSPTTTTATTGTAGILTKGKTTEMAGTIVSTFICRSDKFEIPANGSQVIEILFKPSSERLKPYREEYDIIVDKEDCIRIGCIGRGWSRQQIVTTANPIDEPMGRLLNNIIIKEIEDIKQKETSEKALPSILSSAIQSYASSFNEMMTTTSVSSPLSLINFTYSDLFASETDPTSYVTIGMLPMESIQPTITLQSITSNQTIDSRVVSPQLSPTSINSSTKGKLSKQLSARDHPNINTSSNNNTIKGKVNKSAIVAVTIPTYPPGSRQQTKKLVLSALKFYDNRKTKGVGTYEIILSPNAKASNLFTIIPEKGSMNIDSDIVVDIVYTQIPFYSNLDGVVEEVAAGSGSDSHIKPSSSSELVCYEAEVILKGGWVPTGETTDKRISIMLSVPNITPKK